MTDPRIHVIGIEPGATALPDALRPLVHDSDVLCGAEKHLALVPEYGGERMNFAHGVGTVIERLAGEKRRAAILASGDPGFFGVAGLLLRKVGRDAVGIHPAVSSMQLAFARAGETWSTARFASLHGRPLENLAGVLGAPRIGLFSDPRNGPPAVARFLLESGWDDLEMVVAEEIGQPEERITRGSPCEFLEWSGSDLNVILLLHNEKDGRPVGPGIAEDRFSHSRGLITKSEVRAVALALLKLPREGVLWDVGAGSGSVSVEAALSGPGLRVYAVEKSATGIGHVRENRRRFRVAGVVPVPGTAPEALDSLPEPDRVFVGGSGGRLETVLDRCAQRLAPGGVIVVAAVLIETLSDTLAWCGRHGMDVDFREVSVARSRTVAGRHRLEPQNPVTLVRIAAPAGEVEP